MADNKTGISIEDSAILKVPEENRQHWITPVVIFGGLEFSIPVLMVGATLASSFGLSKILLILFIALFGLQWIGNALSGYIGAKTGFASSVISRSSFGYVQAKLIVSFSIFLISLCWWSLQTAVAGNALSTVIGIEYTENYIGWMLVTIIAGLTFAIPSIIGYESMKWTDYLAVPSGLILVIGGVYLALKNTGLNGLLNWQPESSISFWLGVSLVIGSNVSHWVVAPDYTRYAKPLWSDNLKIPSGIVLVGFPLFLVGAIMAIGIGEGDIVKVMLNLGFPVWGFLILWIATWTSQIVNNYSMGLAIANILNIESNKGRMVLTFIGTIIGIIIALLGILDYFMDILLLVALIYPAIAGVIFADFYVVKKQRYEVNKKWDISATISLVVAIVVGYYTQYIVEFGIPAVQSLLLAFIVFILLKKLFEKDKIKEY